MALNDIQIAETTLEGWQNMLTLMAAKLIIPAALIMKIEMPDIKVFLSSSSEGNVYKVGDSECLLGSGLYCERVFKTKSSLLVPNALQDKEWDKNPDIKLGMLSYLGFPLLWPNGDVFGTICILDSKENLFDDAHKKVLSQFKDYIENYLALAVSKYLGEGKERLGKEMHCDKSLARIEKTLGMT